MRHLFRQLGRLWIRHFGSPLRDERTGEFLGRALVFVWRGRIHMVGFTGEVPLKVVFHAQDKVRYWRQSVGFVRCPKPDFPKLPE